MTSYLLADTTLLGDLDHCPWLKKKRTPRWIAPVYGRDAAHVSPVLIDIERAVQAARVPEMMEMISKRQPQLGVSLIETELTLEQLLQHFRQFIHVCKEDGATLTLRFADCVVLPALAATFTPAQWAALVRPFQSWKVHGRDGRLLTLPPARAEETAALPLVVSDEQIAELADALGTDQLLANLRRMRPKKADEYDTLEAFQQADQARRMWRMAGQTDATALLLFVRDVFDTQGRILRLPVMLKILAQKDLEHVRKDLQRVIAAQY